MRAGSLLWFVLGAVAGLWTGGLFGVLVAAMLGARARDAERARERAPRVGIEPRLQAPRRRVALPPDGRLGV